MITTIHIRSNSTNICRDASDHYCNIMQHTLYLESGIIYGPYFCFKLRLYRHMAASATRSRKAAAETIPAIRLTFVFTIVLPIVWREGIYFQYDSHMQNYSKTSGAATENFDQKVGHFCLILLGFVHITLCCSTSSHHLCSYCPESTLHFWSTDLSQRRGDVYSCFLEKEQCITAPLQVTMQYALTSNSDCCLQVIFFPQ